MKYSNMITLIFVATTSAVSISNNACDSLQVSSKEACQKELNNNLGLQDKITNDLLYKEKLDEADDCNKICVNGECTVKCGGGINIVSDGCSHICTDGSCTLKCGTNSVSSTVNAKQPSIGNSKTSGSYFNSANSLALFAAASFLLLAIS